MKCVDEMKEEMNESRSIQAKDLKKFISTHNLARRTNKLLTFNFSMQNMTHILGTCEFRQLLKSPKKVMSQ